MWSGLSAFKRIQHSYGQLSAAKKRLASALELASDSYKKKKRARLFNDPKAQMQSPQPNMQTQSLAITEVSVEFNRRALF